MSRNTKKSKSSKVKKPTAAQLEKQKKVILKAYIDLKRQNGDPNTSISRESFCAQTGIKEREYCTHFGSYTQLKEIGDAEFKSSLPASTRALLSERSKKFDASATEEDCINDLRRVQEENFGKDITRNFYREHGKYSDSTWNRYFGSFQGFKQRSGLELTRHQQRIERAIAKHSSIDHYREYFNEFVLPYYDKYKKPQTPFYIKKILAMSDFHDRECDRFSLAVFLDTAKRMQPDLIVLNGDIFDLPEFSKYFVDPRHYDIVGRFEFVKDNLFAPLRKFCPNAQIDFIAGNHEMRLLKLLADKTPNVRILLSDLLDISFSDIFGLDAYQINWASKFDLAAYSNSDMKNEIKKNYRIYYNTFIFAHIPDARLRNLSGSNGHHHAGRIESYNFIDEVTHMTRRCTWSQTPGMHVPDAEYLNNLPGWNTGFLEVTVNVDLLEATQKIHFTNDDWAEINGVVYERKDV